VITDAAPAIEIRPQVRGRIGLTPVEWVALVVISLVCLVALIGPFLAPYPADEQRFADGVLKGPGTSHHLLGTDQLARDLLSRLIDGTRISLEIALSAVLIGLVAGLVIGVTAGYLGGYADTVLMRLMDILLAFPALVLALVIAASLGPNLRNTIIAIAVVMVPAFARLARNLTQRESQREYIQSARVTGARAPRIMTVHVLPNIWTPISAQAVLALAYAVPAEAAMSFLGLGVQPPAPSWGNMIADGYAYLSISPWGIILPSIAIVLTVGSVTILADAIRRRTQDPDA
jgi:peptide/nickel transport system permease protein